MSRYLKKKSSERKSRVQAISCSGGLLYGVRPGDTFASIAAKFGIPLSDLIAANPGVDTLQVGMIICIPGIASKICTSGGLVTVAPGDTLFGLATEYGVPFARIIAVNPWIPNPSVLYPGEQVCIPGITPPPSEECTGGLLYAVRSGETCFSIANKFDIGSCSLIDANPTVDCSQLVPGEILCIPGVAEQLCPQGALYTVEPGDTMFGIASEFDLTLEELVAANPWIPNPALIFPGEQLCIPVVICEGGLLYAVRSGETCFSIARKFDITVTALRNANPGLDCARLQIGQILCIPGVAEELCPEGELYTVQTGDTVLSIAQEFGITVGALVAANPWIPNPALIFPGEQLCIPVAPVTCEGGLLYAVRSGETCFSIASKFNITVTALRNANPGLDCARLQIGQILCIPGVAEELCPEGELYTVQTGDTVLSIAQEFGITVGALVAANPWIPSPALIFPGEQLCIPVAPVTCEGGLLYAVRSGETCFSIANKFDITVTELRNANPGIDCNLLQIGQILCIPGVADELCPEGQLYMVEPGDTVFTIAAEFDVSIDALVAANPWIPNPAVIFPGEQLCIPEVPPVTCEGGLLYAVRSGETCFSIANKFDITVTELRNANPGINCNLLQIGQILCIPGVAEQLCPEGELYTVEPGDTVFTIAAEFDVSIDALVAANPWIPNPALIFPGEQLCIPAIAPPVTCAGGLLYGVRSGETCFSIANKFGITVTELRNANPGIDCNLLQIGQILCIPDVAAELCPGGTLYTVQAGDTVFTIARDFGVTIASLVVANPWIPNPVLIFPGEQLCVPVYPVPYTEEDA